MPPARTSSTKALQSNGPRKVPTQKAKKASRQRKIPKGLAEIMTFCHYGIKSDDLFNGDATLTAAAPPSPPEPATATENSSYDTPYSFLPVSPSPNPFHAQIPVLDVDNTTQLAMYYETEVPSPFYGLLQHEVVHPTDVIPSMSNNLVQSYGQYAGQQFTSLPSSSMGYDNQPSQHWLPDSNTEYSISPPPSSCVSNASMTFKPSLYNDIYGETSPAGSSHFAMMSNDGTTVPFPTDDVRHNYYF